MSFTVCPVCPYNGHLNPIPLNSHPVCGSFRDAGSSSGKRSSNLGSSKLARDGELVLRLEASSEVIEGDLLREPGCRWFLEVSLQHQEAAGNLPSLQPLCLVRVCGGCQRGLHHQEGQQPELEQRPKAPNLVATGRG